MSTSRSPQLETESKAANLRSAALRYWCSTGLFLWVAGYWVGSLSLRLLLAVLGVRIDQLPLVDWALVGCGLLVGFWIASLGWAEIRKSAARRAA
jgi:hypothetical protein